MSDPVYEVEDGTKDDVEGGVGEDEDQEEEEEQVWVVV